MQTKYVTYIVIGSIIGVLVTLLLLFLIIKTAQSKSTEATHMEMNNTVYKNQSFIEEI